MKHPFSSSFAVDLDQFLQFKRALGYRYHRPEFMLRSFDRFVCECTTRGQPTRLESAIVSWLTRTEGRKPLTIAVELAVIRQFCLFLRRRQPKAFVPDSRWTELRRGHAKYLPYIFSTAEIRQLIARSATLSGPPLRAKTFRTLILILYCTGLRPGEALRLKVDDVDLATQTFFIAETKGRSRWVPFHQDLAQALRRYLAFRRAVAPAGAQTRLLIGANGLRLPQSTAHGTLCKLFRDAGMKPARGRVGPRPYDFRHTFAVHRLTRWYRAGVDIHVRLPWLSAYMGHDNILGTEKYLTATSELLQIAGRRFEARLTGERRR
jgi:integrase/recombinase XerD